MAERGTLHLKAEDYQVIAAGVLLGVFGGVIGHVYSVGIRAELYTRVAVSLAILVALYCIYQARTAWGGDLARYLEIIGAGLVLFMLTWIPHIEWHIQGSPVLFGLSSGFWLGFFHALTASTFLITAYGFYRFWQEG